MSAGIDCLTLKEQDVRLMVAAGMQLGARNADFQMEPYIYGKTKAGVNIFNVKKTWEKILMAARAIAAVENPADVFAIASNVHAQRAVLKFAKYTGATAVAGRYTPGTLTNQTQTAFREPRLLIVSCPRADHQAITEARYVNVPVIALCNSDAPLRHVDISVPCNNSSINSIGLAWWLLTRQILRFRGTISHESDWDVMPDLFFHRTQEELEKDQKEEAAVEPVQAAAVPPPTTENWDAQPVPSVQAPAGVFGAVGQPAANTEDWGAADDSWGAAATPAGQDWGATAAPETNWG